jgi:MFS family permease
MVGVMLPLTVADVTRHSGRFNLGMGMTGLAGGLGAALSNAGGGAIANHLGHAAAFSALGLAGLVCFILVWFRMPDTKPQVRAATMGIQQAGPGALHTDGHSSEGTSVGRLQALPGQRDRQRRS